MSMCLGKQQLIEKEIWFAEINNNRPMAGKMVFCQYCRHKDDDEVCLLTSEKRLAVKPCTKPKATWTSISQKLNKHKQALWGDY